MKIYLINILKRSSSKSALIKYSWSSVASKSIVDSTNSAYLARSTIILSIGLINFSLIIFLYFPSSASKDDFESGKSCIVWYMRTTSFNYNIILNSTIINK